MRPPSPQMLFLTYLVLWGLHVVAVAADGEYVGTLWWWALTLKGVVMVSTDP